MSQNSTIKKRNPVARNPLLQKGGAHKPSKGVVRPGSKALRDDALAQWDDAQEDPETDKV